MAGRLPDLDLSHPWALEAPAAVELARRCEAAGLGFDARIRNSEGASVSTHRKLRVFGNSHGFVGGYPSTSHSVSCVVVGQDGGDMQRDYWYSAARDWRGLEDVESVGRKAAEKAVQRLGAGKLSTRKAPVLFAPELARGLIGHFTGAIGGAAQYRRSSFLLDAKGEQVFPDWISLVERPHLPGALGSAPFDSEGVATRDRELVVDGVLDGYLLDSYSARKLGLVTTGNAGGVHNLVVQGRMLDPKSLLRQLGTGLLVTEMMGQGVNAVTGDYSRGASGFWVENGEIARPVHEITVAGNLRDMFLGIAALGDDVDRRGAIHCGSLLIAEMTIAGGLGGAVQDSRAAQLAQGHAGDPLAHAGFDRVRDLVSHRLGARAPQQPGFVLPLVADRVEDVGELDALEVPRRDHLFVLGQRQEPGPLERAR